MRTPAVPTGLNARGRALWRKTAARFDFSSEDLLILEEASRCADRIAALEAEIKSLGLMITGSQGQDVINPAVPESRQQQLALQRLIRALKLEGRTPKEHATKARSKSKSTRASVRGRFEVVDGVDEVAV